MVYNNYNNKYKSKYFIICVQKYRYFIMADVSKAQKLKLSHSRKRFKELQELRKNKNVTQTVAEICTSLGNLSHLDTSTSTTHETVNNELIQEDYVLPKCVEHMSHLGKTCKCQQQAVILDDSMQDYNYTNKNLASGSNSDIHNNVISQSDSQNLETGISFSENNIKSKVAAVNVDEAKLKCNVFIANMDADYDCENNLKNVGKFPIGKAAGENVTASENCSDFHQNANVEIWDSNIQSLQELSNQMLHMIESEHCACNSNTDLEKRNIELMAYLKQEKMTSEQQRSLINELQTKVTELEKELKESTLDSNTEIISQMDKLKEELQCHYQTIGLLVAEKTELSVNLSQFELCSKQKSAECEEFKGRLKTSRSRVADLEREINNLKSERNQSKAIINEQIKMIEDLQQECSNIKEQKEELMQDMLELREKLRNSSDEIVTLQQQIKELSSKLLLANIRIQQINNEETCEGELEFVIKQKVNLEKQITELNQNLEIVKKERDESNLVYQQYAQQQNAQLLNISSRLEKLQLENEHLSRQEQDRIRHISELERQLQSLQTDHIKFVVNKSSDSEEIKDLYVQLQCEKKTIEENYMSVLSEKNILLKQLETKNNSVSQMEYLLEQLRGNQPDSAKVLAIMESDKIAAAKAIQQNKLLKQQMESTEEVILKLNNDKVDLTEHLSREINSNKELLEKLQKTELQLQKLTDAIEIKDRELFHLQENLTKLEQPLINNDQQADILWDYETDDYSSHAVLDELKQTKVQLANEINDSILLKRNVNEEEILGQNLKTSYIRNLEKELKTEFSDGIEYINQDSNSNKKKMLDKEIVVGYLEEKVKRTMQNIADLMEEKQRLEHLVTQLQGETETIGEYIALYQQQRMILKQKCLERDQQLKQLAYDRELMKMKFERLTKLVQLAFNKDMISDKQCHQLNNLDKNKSETRNVHSKIMEEIVDILLEMKSNVLIHSDDHPHCPWCSGRLITV